MNKIDYVLFTDASTRSINGVPNVTACGVVLLNMQNMKYTILGKKLPDKTISYGELYGILYGLNSLHEVVKKKRFISVLVITDSEYCVNVLTKHYHNWIDKNDTDTWKTTANKKIKNQDAIKDIVYNFMLNNKYDIEVLHIKSHKSDTASNISYLQNRFSKKYDIRFDETTIRAFIKYNDIADKTATTLTKDMKKEMSI